jgi:hypothetical protein
MKLRKEFRDQSAHMIGAAIALSPAMIFPTIASFAWAGFCCGMIREITELGVPVTTEKIWRAFIGSKLDLTFWTTGAAFAALFYGVN